MRPQVKVFCVSFLGMVALFSSREAWFMVLFTQVKNSIHEENNFSSSFLGTTDFLFLLTYMGGFFLAGELGEWVPATVLAAVGLVGMGLMYLVVALICLQGKVSRVLYAGMWMVEGPLQSAVWIGNVSLMSKWFPPEGRGALFGVWVISCSLGNILGETLSAIIYEEMGLPWEWIAFVTSGLVFIAAALLLLIDSQPFKKESTAELTAPLLHKESSCGQAICNPNIQSCTLCLCCVKWLNFGLLMWLPYFFESEFRLNMEQTGELTAALDLGCIVGSLLGGWLSDKVHNQASVVVGLLLCACPVLALFPFVSSAHLGLMFLLVLWMGITVSGSSNLLFPAMVTDASQTSKGASTKIIGFIIGVGTLSAAMGQAIIGWLITQGWLWVFVHFVGNSQSVLALLGVLVLVPQLVKRKHTSIG
jgi:sugar phosphate permease